MPFIELPPARIYYQCRQGCGAPVLFLHGNLGCTLWWEKLFACLPEGRMLCAVDLPGCGQSGKPGTGYGLDELAATIEAFAGAMGWKRFDLVGHSLGGLLALRICLDRGENVGRVVLIDPAPADGMQFTEETARILAEMGTGRQGVRNGFLFSSPALEPDALFESLVSMAVETDFRFVVAATDWIQHINLLPQLDRIRSEVLVLWGEQDPIIRLDGVTRMVEALPVAELKVLNGVGHSPPIEVPERLAEHLQEFLWHRP